MCSGLVYLLDRGDKLNVGGILCGVHTEREEWKKDEHDPRNDCW